MYCYFNFFFQQIVKASGSDSTTAMAKQIEKDLLRTLPSNACFSTPTSTGTKRLRRILKGLSWLYPDVGYCQGMGVVSKGGGSIEWYRTEVSNNKDVG